MIEMGKRYQTRDGRAVRILATDMKNAYTVVGIVTPSISCLNEFAEVWTSAGESLVHDMGIQNDLIPVPTKHEAWIVVFPNEPPSDAFHPYIFSNKVAAMNYEHSDTRIGHVVPVTWED